MAAASIVAAPRELGRARALHIAGYPDHGADTGAHAASRTEGNELKCCHDRFGQVACNVQILAGKSFTLKYTYAIGGHLYTATYPDGTTVDY